jgi:23S rRNA pseudouridine2605 synthase
VNGNYAEIGSSVEVGRDSVELDGKLLKPQNELKYYILNKPPGFVSSMSDELDRPVAVSLLKGSVHDRVYNVGRLDQWSSGLLLFTNDGSLAKILIHPSGNIDKEYIVTTDLDIPDRFIKDFREGILLDGTRYKALSVERLGPKTLSIVLVEGKNREIRRVLENYGLRAMALRRVRLGPIRIDGIDEGAFRPLSMEEVALLRQYSQSRSNQ